MNVLDQVSTAMDNDTKDDTNICTDDRTQKQLVSGEMNGFDQSQTADPMDSKSLFKYSEMEDDS